MFIDVAPKTGPRTRPALIAAEAFLSDRQWHPWTEVVQAMTDASDILPVSASNQIHALVKAGALERRGKHPRREVRTTPELR